MIGSSGDTTTCGPKSSCSGRDCVKSLWSSCTGLYPQIQARGGSAHEPYPPDPTRPITHALATLRGIAPHAPTLRLTPRWKTTGFWLYQRTELRLHPNSHTSHRWTLHIRRRRTGTRRRCTAPDASKTQMPFWKTRRSADVPGTKFWTRRYSPWT